MTNQTTLNFDSPRFGADVLADQNACHLKGNILVVDDIPDNLRLLSILLRQAGYEVRSALSSKAALMSLSASIPDLILLDIQMPEMNGYELCQHLKQDDRYSHIPIIFLSAYNSVTDKVRAFEVGGVDYISKPCQPPEVLSRINVHLSLRRAQQELEISYKMISELLEKERETNRLRSEFVSMISHDFRTPLTTIQGFASLFKSSIGELSESQQLSFLDKIERSVDTILEMLNSFLLLNKAEQNGMQANMEEFEIVEFCQTIVDDFQVSHHNTHHIEFVHENDRSPVILDPKLLKTILENLISNAIKYSPEGGRVLLSLETSAAQLCFQVRDWGIGIPLVDQSQLFENFYRASNTGKIQGTGLGLAIVKKAIATLQGTIQVESLPGMGTCFTLHLPRMQLQQPQIGLQCGL